MIRKTLTLQTIQSHINNDLKNYIDQCETNYKQEIETVAKHIAENKDLKFVMIAGPSSAGKTTTSALLSLALNKLGLNAHALSLDDFFVERLETPKWENGKPNYESVNAIDWKLFDECVSHLLKNEESIMPTYNFITGKKEFISKLKLVPNDIIIIEGLHALNSIIDNFIPKKYSVKVYISVFTDITDHGKVLMKKSDVRLLRRMVRDMRCRGTMPEQTIINWESVNRGEKLYITPFKNSADFFINSFHPYELAVYKNILTHYKSEKHLELPEVDKFLKKFPSVNKEIVPQFSLIREFTN